MSISGKAKVTNFEQQVQLLEKSPQSTSQMLNSILFDSSLKKNPLKGFGHKARKMACKITMKNIKPMKSILKKI